MASFKMKSIIANLTMRQRALFVVSIIILVIGVFGGIVALSNRFSSLVPIRGGSYKEGIVGSPRFINPVLATSDADHDLTKLVYSGLVRMSQDGLIEPDLASSWDVSTDGKTYTITMKPKLAFHDGKPLTSADVVFTVSKIQDSTLKSPLRVAWDGVTVAAPDAQTVVFTLSKPYAGFLNQLTVGIMPEHLWGKIADDQWSTSQYNSEPVGSGPYKISSVTRSRVGVAESVNMTAFRKFALGAPYIENVSIESFANASDAESAFKAGSIAGLAAIDSGDIATTKTSTTEVLTSPTPRVFGIFFNPSKNKIFADQTVVKALNLAVDKNAIIESVFGGYAHALSGPLPTLVDTSANDADTKLALAAKMLDTAGWKINPKSGLREKTANKATQVLSFSISTANTPELEESANLISEQFQKIGVKASVKVFEIGTLNQGVIRGRDFDALLFGEIVHHDTDIYAFWHSSQRADPGLNITGYTNKHVDSLLESAIKETDPAKRMATYQSISSQLAVDAPVIFLYTPDFIYLVDKSIRNVSIGAVTDPSDRFSNVSRWYAFTDHVWNAFLKQ
ncbi:MAG: family 5 extracellular solute-binding protein peptide/nickel transport system substrate-binding [Patescibacteria group bacterium]|nr:family 5 extracellular solute-binding protein peptide/nickel transport system substrate-binding [Patescibacteria group bacterium]